MDQDFWLERWDSGNIGFHQGHPNRMLVKYCERLELSQGARIFLPLCGKTNDIAWLRERGHHVIGVELAQLAIEELFRELGLAPEVREEGDLICYRAQGIDIFVGDFFNLSKEMIGKIDAVYDRAALVALPEEMRSRYTKHLELVTELAPQLLVTFEYDQRAMAGPPFSIPEQEVKTYYGGEYHCRKLESMQVKGRLKAACEATENVWLLTQH